DAQHAEPQPDAESDRREADVQERGPDRDEEEADDPADGGEDRDEQERDDLALGALGGLRVAVRHALGVVRQARVLEALGDVGDRCPARGGGQVTRGAIRAHEDRAPIHTAIPMMPPMPTSQTQKPSETGPRLPSENPPGATSRCSMM